MSLMAPSILFMLLGGAVADRADCRQLLVRYQLLAIAPPLALAALVATGALGYGALLVYGVAMGTLAAFVIPARDTLLTRVVRDDLRRAVAVTTATQYLAQLVGIVVAGSAGRVGAVALLGVQAAIMAIGALTVSRLAPAPSLSGHDRTESRLAAMRDGLREARQSDAIGALIIAMAAVGVLYVGAFMVIIPVVVRDAYGGGSAELAIVNACFWGGTILSTVTQVRLRAVRRSGRAVMISLAGGAVILAAMAVPTPFYGLALLCLVWGGGAGVVMTQGRIIVQLTAPETHRARLLALFQLGVMGGAPVGAVAIGFIARLTGARPAAVYPALAMVLVLGFLLLRSGLWRQEHAAARS